MGLGGYRHAHLISASFNRDLTGSANFGKRSTMGFGMFCCYQYHKIESPKVLLFLGNESTQVSWLQTGSLDASIFLLRALKVLLIMGGKVTQGLEVSEMLSRCQSF